MFPTRRLFLVAAIAVLSPAAAPADIIYGVTGAGGNPSSLYTINGSNGQATLVNSVTLSGNAVALSGIAYNPINQLLYGTINSTSAFSPNTLVTINTSTGAANLVGSFGPTVFQSNAFSASGVLYGYSKSPTPEGLYTVNTSTGTASRVGASGTQLGFSSSGNGLAVSSTGTIYLAPGGASGQTNAKLYTVNPATGVATAGPAFSSSPLASSQMKALAFDSDGNLFGLNFAPGSPFTTHLVSINATTGTITDIGQTQDGMIGMAFVPAAAVPEPSPALLTAIPVMLGGVFFAWRRRRTQVCCYS